MNTKHIHDLTLRLCQAIDQNYDVVNMEAVMSVISTLEGTKITKEQLETTRLAKFINLLRRRTKDEHLARRAKSLLKKWREMVGIQQQQQVTDTTPTTSSATLPSVSGHNTSLFQQQRLRSQSVSPAASSMHFDAIPHQSNSNSSQIAGGVSSTPSAVAEHVPRVTNAISGSLASLSTASSNAYISNKRLVNIENQSERTSGAAIHVKKQPTSFENVLVGFGVTDRSNVDISSDISSYRNKLNKSIQQHVAPQDAETFIIDQSSNSNSEKSLMLPLNSRPANLAPIIIDIQDSNSGSNLVTPISTINKTISNKIPINRSIKAQSVSLDSKLNTAISPTKQKKVRKDKKRKERNEYDIHGGIIDAVSDSKVATVLLDETSSNQQPHRQSGETDEKYSSFVNEEKSRLAYPEILSLLDNSSMSSMFPPDNSTHPIDEQNKVNFSASNSSRTSFNLSTSDLTFAGKFKPSNAMLPTTSSSDAVLYNSHRRPVSPKNTTANNNFTLHSGPTTSKFTPFRDVGYNSNDSNSNSQASQTDLIDVVSNDKMMHAQKKQDNLNLQNRATPAINVLIPQAVPAANVPPPKLQSSNNSEVTSNAPIAPEKKVPRKRGRKKGSKGVDSIIAKETSLSSQMLISTLGMGSKKVKTTKELYAEMQNRKLGIPASSPSPSSTGWQMSHQQQQSSRPTSSCSEPSLQSPHTFDACSTNATMSTIATRSTPENFLTNAHAGECETTSDTGTSEPSRDSSAIPKHLKRSLSIDSNSNIQQMPEIKINSNSPCESNKNSDTSNQIAAIEKQLREFLTKLPPVPLTNAIQLKCTAELVPCTCKVIEISPTRNDSGESAENVVNEDDAGKENQHPNDHEQQLDTFTIKQESNGANTFDPNKSNLKMMPPNSPLPAAVPKPKPKKSIFDLDFDEDEDPLPKIIAEAAAASLKKEQESITEVQAAPEMDEATVSATLQQTETIDIKVPVEPILTQLVDEIPIPILPTYEVEEDPHCVAKQRFDLQTQKITKFHIDALHNCYIPNVNGNWDDSNYTIAQHMTMHEVATAADVVEHCYVITDGSNVVPKYGSVATEHIPKDLSHINFFENSMPKKTTASEQMCTIPFLGVARSVLRNRFQFKSHNHKTCHKAKVTTLNKCASHSNVCAVEQLEAYKRTEEYKTDEAGICNSVMTKNNQTANENVTVDTVVNVSKGFTDICDQFDDTVHSLTQTYDVAAGAIVSKNNNNNVMLKDITIDVDGHGSDLFMPHAHELNENERNGQNLLAIADHLDYSTNAVEKTPLNLTNTVNTCSNIVEPNNIPQEVKGYSEEGGSATVVTASSSYPNTHTPSIDNEEKNGIENAYSRRSSSCSNSSLKQTQQSINLKLKHQFQDQTIVDVNGERKRKRRKGIRRSLTKNVHGTSGVQDKQSKIKRIKIAINGKVTTHMQFSGSSSNHSSDEDNATQTTEHNVGHDNMPIDDRNVSSAHMVAVEMEENTSGSHNSTHNQYNLASGDDEHCVNSVENNYNDEQQFDYDYYGDPDIDGDVEFDDYEDADDYSGDFHEVVTRDISASSTGNNHIVLTIKKTPSKTNSPSNSLSAMSPVIASNNMYGAQATAVTISPIVAKPSAVQTNNTVGDIDMNALIVKKLVVCEATNNALTTEHSETATLTSAATIQPQYQTDVQLDTNPTLVTLYTQKCVDTKNSPKRNLDYSDPENCVSAPITKCVHIRNRQQHRRRKFMKSTKEHSEFSRDIKLHRELFFAHEIFVTDFAGVKQSILNFSSCSSSCADDSDYEHCNDLTDTSVVNSNEKSGVSAHAEIDIKLEALKKEYSVSKMVEMTQQCKRALSASPCSTYSTCSTCHDLSTENDVITQFDNAIGDAPDLKTKIGVVEGGAIGGNTIVDKVDGVDNSETALTVNTVISNTKSIPILADATDNKLEDNVNEELPLENNGLLYSFNNIYYTKDKLEAQTNYAAINNGGTLVDMRRGHMLSDIGDAGPAAVYAAKQQEQMLPNKNCDDYNNIYNKNSNNINLIRYYINEPSLKNNINRNKQSGSRNEFVDQQNQNYINVDDDCNVNPVAAAVNIDKQPQFADNDNKTVINVDCTADIEQKADNSVTSFNNSGANDEKIAIDPSVATRCTQIMVPHKENRTGLRAVDEDVDDEDGNNCARIQQFKEWHQVLQLRSYNDELLTVLPYVVLD